MDKLQEKKYLLPALALGVGVSGALYFLLRAKKPVPQQQQLLRLLTRADCARRRRMLGDSTPDYNLELFIQKNREEYHGRIVIRFDLVEIADLTLDFQRSSVRGIIVNDKELPEPAAICSVDQIFLSQTLLQLGQNTVIIEFTNLYDKDDMGLLKHEENGKVFVHTVVCGYLPSLVFPCFDQPDIKCTLKLKVIMPNDLKVIVNERVVAEEALKESAFLEDDACLNYKEVDFMKSKKIPIHDFGLMIGDFEQRKFTKGFKGIPLSVYYPKSQAANVNYHFDNIVASTIGTLEFFYNTFGSKYPFSKLDLVYMKTPAPAIEYPGCILINEHFLTITSDNNYAVIDQYLIVIHEIVHMWFGNLITCDWWDNIFTHEAVANFISTLIMREVAPKLKNVPFNFDLFLLFNKARRSMIQAALPYTRSVKFDMTHLELGNSVFDPITYNKGEALLYYFYDNIGERKFFDALKKLVQTKAWGNIEYQAFLELFEHADRDELDGLLKLRQVDAFEAKYLADKKELRISRSVNHNNSFNYKSIELIVYDFAQGTSVCTKHNLSDNTLVIDIDLTDPQKAFILNKNLKGYFVYSDDEDNFNKLVRNVSKVDTNDLHAYFLNVYNNAIIYGASPARVARLFVAGYNQLTAFAPKSIVRLVYNTAVNYAGSSSSEYGADLVFDALVKHNELEKAVAFAQTAAQVKTLIDLITVKSNIGSIHEWKRLLMRLSALQEFDLLNQLLPKYKQLFTDNEFFETRNLFADDNLYVNWSKVVLFRAGFHNLDYYQNVLRYVKKAFPIEKRIELAKIFLRDIDKIVQNVSKFYVKRLINNALPAERFAGFVHLKSDLMLAVSKVADRPFILDCLMTRIELMALYNK